MNYDLEKKRTPKPNPSPVQKKPITPVAAIKPSPVRASPEPKTGAAAAKKPTANVSNKTTNKTTYETKIYTDAEITTALEGYIYVHSSLWDHLPAGAHIRFVKKGTESRGTRFKPGGFVKNHFTNEEGKKFLMIETKPNGRHGEQGYFKFPIAYEDVEELWKKYDRKVFIEFHLISQSMAHKKKQIEDLTARIAKLENILISLSKR
jgi:hypothetical protein